MTINDNLLPKGIVGKVLYENSNGSLLPITLNDNYMNYDLIKIIAGNNDSSYFDMSETIIMPKINLRGNIRTCESGNAWFTYNICHVKLGNNNQLTKSAETHMGGANGSWNSVAAQTNPSITYIYKVIGYKN